MAGTLKNGLRLLEKVAIVTGNILGLALAKSLADALQGADLAMVKA